MRITRIRSGTPPPLLKSCRAALNKFQSLQCSYVLLVSTRALCSCAVVFNLVRGKEVNVVSGYGISGVLDIGLEGSEQRAGGNV